MVIHTKVFAAMVLRAAAGNLVGLRAFTDRYMYMHVQDVNLIYMYIYIYMGQFTRNWRITFRYIKL